VAFEFGKGLNVVWKRLSATGTAATAAVGATTTASWRATTCNLIKENGVLEFRI
jgi:hypothetical protein